MGILEIVFNSRKFDLNDDVLMGFDNYFDKKSSLERANNGNKAENIILKENIRGTNGRGTSAFDDAANQYIE